MSTSIDTITQKSQSIADQGPLWEVFIQSKPGQPFKHAGSVHAYDKEMAIENARDVYTRRNEGVGLWADSQQGNRGS